MTKIGAVELGRLHNARVTQHLRQCHEVACNSLRELTSITDPLGNVTALTHTPVGLIAIVVPLTIRNTRLGVPPESFGSAREWSSRDHSGSSDGSENEWVIGLWAARSQE